MIIRLNIRLVEPPEGLNERIMNRIHRHKTIRARWQAAAHGTLGIAALVVLIPSLDHAITSAAESGMYEYISLIASDGGPIAANWKSATLSIAESAPIMGIALTLGALAIGVYSLRKSAVSLFARQA